jgi:hypothetical protein
MFHETYVQDTFFESSYVYDVYVDNYRKVWLLSFKPLSSHHTDPLLFKWNELYGSNGSNGSNAINCTNTSASTSNDGLDNTNEVIHQSDQDNVHDDQDDDGGDAEVDTSFPFRVVKSEANAKKNVISNIINRLPKDGIDLSDAAAIERQYNAALSERKSSNS